jgi:hypothetical protein
MPQKMYWACKTCGLSTKVKVTSGGKTMQALKRGDDCPVCKGPTKVIPRPEKQVHFTLKGARKAKKELDEQRHGGRQYEGVGSKVLSRAEGRSLDLEPYEWDPAA